jgi:hypothetical protein
MSVRLVGAFSGTLDTCDKVSGITTVSNISGKSAIDQHIEGCHLVGGGDCDNGNPMFVAFPAPAAQADFVDRASPIFKVGAYSKSLVKRVPSTTTCADVRGMDFDTP